LQRRLHERFPNIQDVTIHMEPSTSPGEQSQEQIAVQLRRLADGLGIGVHGVWVHEIDRRYYTEVHLEVDGGLSLRQAHERVSLLEERARAEIPHLVELTTHIEPQGQLIQATDPGLAEAQVAQLVQQAANDMLDAEACHRVQVRHHEAGWTVSMHCYLPGEISLTKAHQISTRLEIQLLEKVPGLERVIIHTEPWENR
jgi:divalent metal cation (Fe/Co/Zn/Cd) transporter